MTLKKATATLLLSLPAIAAQAEGWTSSVGVQHITSKSTQPTNPSDSSFDAVSLSLSKQLDDRTFLGGSLSYNKGDTTSSANSGTTDHKATAGAVFVVRNLGSGYLADASLGYGTVRVDGDYLNGAAPTFFKVSPDFWMVGAGVTKILPLTPSLVGTVSARLNHSSSKSSTYTDSSGAPYSGNKTQRTGVSLGGGLTWLLGAWTPSVNVQYQHSNRNYLAGVSDKEYISYSLGLSYALSTKHTLSFGYAGAAEKKFSKEKSLSATLSSRF